MMIEQQEAEGDKSSARFRELTHADIIKEKIPLERITMKDGKLGMYEDIFKTKS